MDHFVGRDIHSRSYSEPSSSHEEIARIDQRVTGIETEMRSLRESVEALVQAIQRGMQR